jgi:RNA polymerase sigma factor (sigma-70 family)
MNPPPPAEGFTARLFAGPALRAQSDRRLVTLVRDGYESAFEEIVRRYAKPLSRYAAGIVGSRSEDVTQDAFSKALLALRKDSEADIELRPWLYRIVRNTALNDLRDGPPPGVELTEPLAGGGLSAAEEFERREELEELLDRLRALPDPQRAAIVMRELEGLGHEEIAKSLGMSGGAARQAIFRARQALRNGLGFLIPLPLMRMLLEHGAGAEAGIAAGAGGAALAAGGAAGGAGAATALKVGVVTAVLAGSVGTGLAIKDRPQDRGPDPAAAATLPVSSSNGTTEADSGSDVSGGDDNGGATGRGSSGSSRNGDSSGHGSGDNRGGSVAGGDDFESSGPGSGGRDDGRHHSGGREPGDDGSHHGGGPGPSGDDGGRDSSGSRGGDDGGHHGGGPGPSGGDDGGGGSSGGSSGSGSGSGSSGGSGGSGTSGGGGSGSSGSGSGSTPPPPPPPSDGSNSSGSGSGSGSSGSGDGSSDSSGSGSGGDDLGVEGSGLVLP